MPASLTRKNCFFSRPILHKYANEDVSLGSWFIGLDVEHIDDRSLCCGTPLGKIITIPFPYSDRFEEELFWFSIFLVICFGSHYKFSAYTLMFVSNRSLNSKKYKFNTWNLMFVSNRGPLNFKNCLMCLDSNRYEMQYVCR